MTPGERLARHRRELELALRESLPLAEARARIASDERVAAHARRVQRAIAARVQAQGASSDAPSGPWMMAE